MLMYKAFGTTGRKLVWSDCLDVLERVQYLLDDFTNKGTYITFDELKHLWVLVVV